MRRNADAPGPTLVLDRDGRALPFDGRRLGDSIRRALTSLQPGAHATAEAEDLARVVGRYLERPGSGRTVTAEDLAGFVLEVLQGTGHEEAARLYARTRADGAHVVALQVAELLEAEAELPPDEAAAIGREVEAGLHAAGVREPGVGLLRAWVDHALVRHGHVEAVGRGPVASLPVDEFRSLLVDGPPGVSAEVRGAGALLSAHVLRDVFPGRVAEAHGEGRLDLGGLTSRSRVHGVCVAPWSLPVLRDAPEAARMAVLGELLRDLAGLATREVAVLWNGPTPDADRLRQLEHELATPPEAGARIVLCLDGADGDHVRAFLAQPTLTRTCRLRVHGPRVDATLFADLAARPSDVEVARRAPRPGLVAGSAAVNLLRHAQAAPGRDPGRFLDAVEESAGLAAGALDAWRTLGAGEAAARTVGERLGAHLPWSWWLEPAGMVQARVLLLGAGARARHNGRDLAAAVGERLRRGWFARWPEAAGDDVWEPERAGPAGLELLPAPPRVQRRFRRLDLPLPRGGDDHPAHDPDTEPLGEGETFSHDGEVDPAARGREVVLLRRALGCAAFAPAPRKASDPLVREAFLRAFLEPSLDEADIAPCA